MSNTEIDQKIWEVVRFMCRFHDRMHWRPYYSEILNKEIIKDHLATDQKILDHIKKIIDYLWDSVKIEGYIIKIKGCPLPTVSYTIRKLEDNIFGCPH